MKFQYSKPYFDNVELDNVQECIKSTFVGAFGPYLDKFNKDFKDYIWAPFGMGISNASTALHLACIAAGLKKEDQVIAPNFTFVSSINCIKYVGATPIFIDADYESYSIDPNQLESALTKYTKAIIVPHLYGRPAKIEQIFDFACKHGLILIEDNAQSYGSFVGNGNPGGNNPKMTGNFGKISVYSFNSIKMMSCGEGGYITTNDEKIFAHINQLQQHGSTPGTKYFHDKIGFNYRMTNLQASVLCAQFEKLPKFIEKRRQIHNWYVQYLKDIKEINLPPEINYGFDVYWINNIFLADQLIGKKELFMQKLLEEGIETRPMFTPINRLPMYRTTQYFPVSDFFWKRGVSLPTYYTMSEEDIYSISKIIKNIIFEIK